MKFLVEYIGFLICHPKSYILNLYPERSHRGLVRWFAKPVKESNPFGGSNPPLSARKFYFMEEYLSVLIVDQSIDDKGILTNAGFVLGLTAGRELPNDTFGKEVIDGDGSSHKFLTKIGHFVRKASQNKMRELRSKLINLENVKIVDYTEDAAPADYEEYSNNLKAHKGEEIKYRALYLYGPKEIILPLTKNLSRLS